MARFVFELQAVLDHRERAVEMRQRAVAEVELERARLEGVVRECQRGIAAERAEMRRVLAGGGARVDIALVRTQAGAAVRLAAVAQQAVLQLAGVHKRLEAVRLELLKAERARKAVELLRERRHEAWRIETARREAAAQDELMVMRAWRSEGAA